MNKKAKYFVIICDKFKVIETEVFWSKYYALNLAKEINKGLNAVYPNCHAVVTKIIKGGI